MEVADETVDKLPEAQNFKKNPLPSSPSCSSLYQQSHHKRLILLSVSRTTLIRGTASFPLLIVQFLCRSKVCMIMKYPECSPE